MEPSVEECRRLEEDCDIDCLTQRVYKPTTERLQKVVLDMWHDYCQRMNRDPISSLRDLNTKVLYAFFNWFLQNPKTHIASASTLQTYWNVFCQIYKEKGRCGLLDPLIKSQMHGVRQRLAMKFGLKTEKKKKPIMRAEDEFELLKTLYLSPEMTFNHERHRIELALIMQLAGITGNRPGALLGLRYQDIRVTLLRDPYGSPIPRRIVEVAFTDTKGYLGQKESNEFGIPEVRDEPCLLLCPQINLLALIFLDRAFAAPSLSVPDALFGLRVPSDQNQLELPLKKELNPLPLFRRSEASTVGMRISPSLSVTYNSLRDWMIKLGTLTGMELPTGPYTFRRGAGEAFDSSSFITEAQRNSILQHQSSSVFVKNYSSRYITSDVQAARRGLAPQTALMRMASGMSRTIDRRRPRKLSSAQQRQIDHHPEVKLLSRQQKSLKEHIKRRFGPITKLKGSAIHSRYDQMGRDYRNLRSRLEQALLREIKATYKVEQPIRDIQSQLSCPAVLMKQADQKVEFAFKERTKAIDALFTFAFTPRHGVVITRTPKIIDSEKELPEERLSACTNHNEADIQEERRRRVTAIEALIALGQLHEARQPRSRGGPPAKLEPDRKSSLPLTSPILDESLPLRCHPTQCIFCLGCESLPEAQRLKIFHSRGTLKKHFYRKHLRHHPNDEAIDCPHPRCQVTLRGKMHLQNHAARTHGTIT